ncbi:hypothetical protein HDU76_008435 [Blyttiomyces sp. JEL0837]|nr:hypothetical protein HDU76_008435 [Blyttiomyces sp. JEL0837]
MTLIAVVQYWKWALLPAVLFLETLRGLFMATLINDTSVGQTFPTLNCTGQTDYRTIDGTCNDLVHPWAGSKYYRFSRIQPLTQIVADSNISIGGHPNPRSVGYNLLGRKNGVTKYAPQQNLFAAAWIQFQTHDWFGHGDIDNTSFINVPIPSTDPLYKAGTANVMKIGKSRADPNQPSIYNRQNVMTQDICDVLSTAYPSWTDEQIFRKARLVNSAISAKIHTVEWTPALLAEKVLTASLNINWNGFPPIQYPPLIGNKGPAVNGTYQLPEEFVSIYRMHPLLPDTLPIQPIGATAPVAQVNLNDAVFSGSGILRKARPMADYLNSFGTNLMGALTLNNHPTALVNLKLPSGSVIDMSTIDVVRDRERGVPRYNAYRRILQMPSKVSFSDINPDPVVVSALSSLYQNVEEVDLLVGSLAESDRPDGFAFSETTFRLFLLVASRRLFGDRLFAEDYGPTVYTPEGIDIINKANFSTVLATSFPELAPTLKYVANPFLKWNDATIQGNWVVLLKSIQAEVGSLVTQLGNTASTPVRRQKRSFPRKLLDSF